MPSVHTLIKITRNSSRLLVAIYMFLDIAIFLGTALLYKMIVD